MHKQLEIAKYYGERQHATYHFHEETISGMYLHLCLGRQLGVGVVGTSSCSSVYRYRLHAKEIITHFEIPVGLFFPNKLFYIPPNTICFYS